MKFNRFFFLALISLFFTPPLSAWQIIPYQQEDSLFIQESQVALNLVFVPLNYEQRDEFKDDVSSISDKLRQTPPFDEFKGLKVYFLRILPDEEAVLFKRGEEYPYLKIRNDLIEQLEVRLDAPYKLVILDKQGSVTAAELSKINKFSMIILGKRSNNTKAKFAKAFLHEIGHSLGLREENPRSSHQIIPGPPNCAPDKQTALNWWGDMVGKIQGVGYISLRSGENIFIKPTSQSLMNNPRKSNTYGPVNERYLREELELNMSDK